MDRKNRNASNPPSLPGAGLRRDVRQASEGVSASTAELRQFLHDMRGRSPKEMLGMVAQSGLMKATTAAAIGFVVVLVVFTLVPFGWAKLFPPGEQTTAAKADDDKKTADQKADAAKAEAAKPPTAEQTAAKKAGDDLINKLGIGEQKPADPKTNPLDSKADDLLKGLD
jgi:hypothetical protein